MQLIEDRCTYDVLAALMESVIVEYSLARKVSYYVTGSRSNIVNARAEFGRDMNETTPCSGGTDNATSCSLADRILEKGSDALRPAELSDILEKISTVQQIFLAACKTGFENLRC